MKLLERDQCISDLNTLFEKVKNGNGVIVSVSGEAGIGKTSLVKFFTDQVKDQYKIFWGICDDLYTPRPLAPLYDIAYQLKGNLITQLDSGIPRPSIFSNFLNEIQNNEPNIIVIEDIHWADESTLDLLKFLGRRINKLKTLLIFTYRDDEIKSDHPLKLALSTFQSSSIKRIKLNPLSENAVNTLALKYGKNDSELYAKTSGNPLLVTEVLLNDQTETPPTIKELFTSKLNRLSSDGKQVVELISVIPGKAEKWLIQKLVQDLTPIDEILELGILKSESDSFSFRHELARMAIEESLSETKRIKLNTIVLKILLEQENTYHLIARIIHHASKANDTQVIIKYAPMAAKQASDLDSHRQAIAHYSTALKYSYKLTTKEHLDLLEAKSYECYLTGNTDEGVNACESILKILEKFSDPFREGTTYRIFSRFMWDIGEDEKGEQFLKKSIMILEKLAPSKQLAMAYSNLSSVYAHRGRSNITLSFGDKAIQLARMLNDLETEVHALNNIGIYKMRENDDSGEWYLTESLRLSLKNDLYEQAARAYCNLGAKFLWRRNLTEAEKYLSMGLRYCNDKDFDNIGLTTAGDYAKVKLFMCQWDEAIEFSNFIFKWGNVSASNKIYALCVIGQIRARRMDPGALKLLEEAKLLAFKVGETDRRVTVISARAEYYWLQNKLNEVVDELFEEFKYLIHTNNIWAIGEMAYWIWKAGNLKEVPQLIAKPYFLQIQGNWREAAELWKELKCPYEEALALSEGDEKAMKKAIEIFEKLGASATVQLIKHKMRESGIKGVPKGPRQSTKKNFAGLTARQLEVLKLVANGMSNSEIADNLYISAKTVDHHISAIYSKLNIHSRIEAASVLNSNFAFQK